VNVAVEANSLLVARRYAQAALELALAHNNLEQWQADLAALAQVWEQTRIAARLDDPKLGRTRRLEEARTALQGHINPLALNLVLVLVERGRASLLPQIAAAFERLERERERRVTAYVTSALPLTDAQRARLREQLERRTGQTVELEENVDPTIIGGLIVRVGDELIDASVAGRLHRIEAQLSSQ
jgi:F-type H+-transporting ATPase subunit delta